MQIVLESITFNLIYLLLYNFQLGSIFFRVISANKKLRQYSKRKGAYDPMRTCYCFVVFLFDITSVMLKLF